jgi:hypothetical protein
MTETKERVRQSLVGLAERNVHRNAARKMLAKKQRLYVLRKAGRLDRLENAKDTLRSLNISWKESTHYGVTILESNIGVVLVYLPSGALSWSTVRRRPGDVYHQDQIAECFSDSPSVSASCPPCAPGSEQSQQPVAGT